jgi:hypothetical protein
MNFVSKVWTLTFVVLLLSSLMTLAATPTRVQAVSNPLVPRFSVKLVDNSYNQAPAYTTDPYTGDTKSLNAGGRVRDMTIEVTIKNQPFTPYTNTSGYKIELHFKVEVKGYFGENWHYLGNSPFITQHGSEDTILVVNSAERYFSDGSQVDFRVKAVVAYDGTMYDVSGLGMRTQYWLDEYESSNWSDIQTITIPSEYSSLHSQITSSPQNQTIPSDNNQPQLSGKNQLPSFVFHQSFLLWIGALLFVGGVIAVVIVFTKRHLKFKH